jgi:hypothetical protein
MKVSAPMPVPLTPARSARTQEERLRAYHESEREAARAMRAAYYRSSHRCSTSIAMRLFTDVVEE